MNAYHCEVPMPMSVRRFLVLATAAAGAAAIAGGIQTGVAAAAAQADW